jgi:hypothetical protein
LKGLEIQKGCNIHTKDKVIDVATVWKFQNLIKNQLLAGLKQSFCKSNEKVISVVGIIVVG